MDGFEPVGFTLAVITVDDVQPRSPKNLAAQISKIVYFERLDDHHEILAYDSISNTAVEAGCQKEKRSSSLWKESAFSMDHAVFKLF